MSIWARRSRRAKRRSRKKESKKDKVIEQEVETGKATQEEHDLCCWKIGQHGLLGL